MSTPPASPALPDRPVNPSAANQRCATRADLRGDPMIGTAFPASRLLLIEQPGAWGRRGLRDSRFPAGPAEELERRANAAHLRVQVIRRPGRAADPDAPRVWGVADTRPASAAVRWGTWTDPAELLRLPLDDPPGETDDRPVYLVCSHSKHDVCCALRGRPVAEALHAARPGQVWETSHLGGDRFGANVLVLPLGVLYGRMLPFAAGALAAATDAGEALVPLLRGYVGIAPAAQAALAHAATELAVPQVRSLSVLAVSAGADATTVVRLRAPVGEVEVTVHAERVAATGLTCANPNPSAYLAYHATGLHPV